MAGRIVPMMSNSDDIIPIAGLEALEAHLDAVLSDPSIDLIPKLFDDVELQLNETNTLPAIPLLLPRLVQLLQQSTHDPELPATLTTKLLAPVPLVEVFRLADSAALEAALDSGSPATTLLALAIIAKVPASASEAGVPPQLPPLMGRVIRAWLGSPHVEVGERAGKVLGDVLEADCEVVPSLPAATTTMPNGTHHTTTAGQEVVGLRRRRAPGHGHLWRLIFRDERMMRLIVSHCVPGGVAGQTARQTSLAQGRLLRILPRLASLHFAAVSASPFEVLHETGLLQWAALLMVDKSDLLMHRQLVDFFETLVSVMRVADQTPAKTAALRALVHEAVGGDEELAFALRTLPDRTVPEEAEPLRRWIRTLMDGS